MDNIYETQLMEMVASQEGQELTTKLSMVLTQSSLAHQYALINLTEVDGYPQKEAILNQIEESKQHYFFARELLSEINPEKLFILEAELRIQKEVVFGEKRLLN